MKNTMSQVGKKLGLLLICIFSIGSVPAATIYVKSTAAGANNGTSWANAYTSLQSALTASVSGDQIWVAAGVYKPTSQVDVDASGGSDVREVTFRLPNGVKLFGGFAGMEATLAERNWALNRTILSGDIDNNDLNADANFIAENTTHIVGNNAYHVVYTANVNAATWLDGFIITAGKAYLAAPPNPNVPNLDGGGWYNRISAPVGGSSPTLVNCLFQGNYAESEGAGFYTTPGTVFVTMASQIRSCRFIQNRSNFSGGAIFVGSYTKGNYRPVITGCEFTGNHAYRYGGAIYMIGDSARINISIFRNNKVTVVSPDGGTLPGSGGGVGLVTSKAGFRQCIFIGNSTTGNPTGPFEGGGGGAVCMSTNDPQTTTLGESKHVFIGCGFYNNVAQGNTTAWGGAVVHRSDAGRLSVKYTNCVFANNTAQQDGGAVANFTRVAGGDPEFSPALRTEFTNCTFSANAAGRFGGGIYNSGYVYLGVELLTNRVENTILHGNSATTNGPQIYNNGNTSQLSYCLVQGSGGSGPGWNATVGTDLGNNIDVSPGFVNAADPDGVDNSAGTADDGLRILTTSAAIDVGNSGVVNLVGIATDFIGDARLQGAQVDIGAYERTSFLIPNPKIYWLYPWKIVRPVCLSCPWAIRLNMGINEKPNYFTWKSPAQLLDYGDYAEVVGTLVSQDASAFELDVYLKLVKPQDWNTWSAQQRTYNAETVESQKIARSTHPDWQYWALSEESYLKGRGGVKGTLFLQHAPETFTTGFQLGVGANAQDADTGLSGEFYYRGKLTYLLTNKTVALKGMGSLNADAELCEKNCDGRSARLDNTALSDSEKAPAFVVYPNPAREWLTIASVSELPYQVQLFNFQGQQLPALFTETGQGQKSCDLKGLAPGLYLLKITDDSGNIHQQKVLKQE